MEQQIAYAQFLKCQKNDQYTELLLHWCYCWFGMFFGYGEDGIFHGEYYSLASRSASICPWWFITYNAGQEELGSSLFLVAQCWIWWSSWLLLKRIRLCCDSLQIQFICYNALTCLIWQPNAITNIVDGLPPVFKDNFPYFCNNFFKLCTMKVNPNVYHS